MGSRPKVALQIVVSIAVLVLAGANWPGDSLPGATVADHVVVDKSERTLILFNRGIPIKSYAVALGRNPVGLKEREGDNRTPEGMYRIDRRKRDSAYHLALHVSYPAPADAERAARRGVRPGGDIMIHGLPNGLGWIGRLHRAVDWTAGCIAVTNREIEELWRVVPDGTPIDIRP